MTAKIKVKKEISAVFDTVATSPPKKVRRLWREFEEKNQNDIHNPALQALKTTQNEDAKTRTQTRTSSIKTETQTRTNGPKLGHKLGQIEDKTRTQTRTSKSSYPQANLETETQTRTNRGQIEDNTKTQTRTDFAFLALSNLQRKIFFYLADLCHSSIARETPYLSSDNIIEFTQSTVLSVRKTIQRLEKKGLIIRKSFKRGRSGWTQYELPKRVFEEFKIFKYETQTRTKLGQIEDNTKTQTKTQTRTSPPSSSSYIYTTTTKEEGGPGGETAAKLFDLSAQGLIQLSPEWAEVDILPLEPFGFTQNHLYQIIQQNKLTPDVLQESINAFAYDLRVNKKDKNIKSSLNYFMGILRKGIPYAPPENYKTPEQEAWDKYNRSKKSSDEKLAKLQQETQDLEFESWVNSLSDEERKKLSQGAEKGSFLEKGHLRNHFNKEIWSAIKDKVFESAKVAAKTS